MKLIYVCAFFVLIGTSSMYCQPGCMSKSQKLKQKFDTKAWHYVACNCDCKNNAPKGLYAQKQNKCIECGHRHEPRPLIFMQQLAQNRITHNTFPPSASESIQNAINRFKGRK